MSYIKTISLVHKENIVQQLSFNHFTRKETILKNWRHQYGGALRKASIKITKP